MATLKVIDILPDGFSLIGSQSGATVFNAQFHSAQFLLNVLSLSGTNPTLSPAIQAQDPASGTFVNLPGGTFLTRTATGITVFEIGPGLLNIVGRSKNGFLPARFRFFYTIGGTATPTFVCNFKGLMVG
jgi:hypothetical protein